MTGGGAAVAAGRRGEVLRGTDHPRSGSGRPATRPDCLPSWYNSTPHIPLVGVVARRSRRRRFLQWANDRPSGAGLVGDDRNRILLRMRSGLAWLFLRPYPLNRQPAVVVGGGGEPDGVIDQRLAVAAHTAHRSRPRHSEGPGRSGDRPASAPTSRQISAPARTVSSPPGSISGEVSLHVTLAQSPSLQPQSCFAQHSTTGRPDTGRSRTSTRRHP